MIASKKRCLTGWVDSEFHTIQYTNHHPLTTHLTGAAPRHRGTPEPWNERPVEWKVFAILGISLKKADVSFGSIQGARSLAGTSGDAPRRRHVAVHGVARTTRSHTGPSLTMLPEAPGSWMAETFTTNFRTLGSNFVLTSRVYNWCDMMRSLIKTY